MVQMKSALSGLLLVGVVASQQEPETSVAIPASRVSRDLQYGYGCGGKMGGGKMGGSYGFGSNCGFFPNPPPTPFGCCGYEEVCRFVSRGKMGGGKMGFGGKMGGGKMGGSYSVSYTHLTLPTIYSV